MGFVPVFGEETTEHTHATHPDHLDGHTRIGGTLALTVAGVAALGLGHQIQTVSVLGVHGDSLRV